MSGALLWAPAALAAAVGVLSLLAAVAWRRGAPRVDTRAAGDGTAARAIRDGAATGFALVGIGTLAVGVGYLGTVGSLAARAGGGGDGPTAALAGAAPLYGLGGAVLVAGFCVLVASTVVGTVAGRET